MTHLLEFPEFFSVLRAPAGGITRRVTSKSPGLALWWTRWVWGSCAVRRSRDGIVGCHRRAPKGPRVSRCRLLGWAVSILRGRSRAKARVQLMASNSDARRRAKRQLPSKDRSDGWYGYAGLAMPAEGTPEYDALAHKGRSRGMRSTPPDPLASWTSEAIQFERSQTIANRSKSPRRI